MVAVSAIGIYIAQIDVNPPENGDDEPPLPGWRDTEMFRTAASGLDGRSYSSLATLDSLSGAPPGSVLVAFGFDRAPTEEEAAAIEAFTDSGGSLILADDGAMSARVCSRYSVAMDGGVLRETEKNVHFLVNSSVLLERAVLDGRPYNLVFNVATGLDMMGANSTFTVICNSSGVRWDGPDLQYSWYDRNNDGQVNLEDLAPSAPLVIARSLPGGGAGVFMGDSAPFTDMMWGMRDNGEFVEDLMSLCTRDGGYVYYWSGCQTADHSNNLQLPDEVLAPG